MSLSKEREQEVIALCQALIRERSYSGEERGVVEVMEQWFRRLGFGEVKVDSNGSIVGRIRGSRPGKVLLLDGHIDTVPVPDALLWTHAPFSGEIAGGRIYGRGTSDMKGAVSAMMVAAGYFVANTNRDFAGEICVSGVVHEECFEGIAARRIREQVMPNCVVIGEASELNLKRGQRGRAEVVVETLGRPAHSANPAAGVNAVYKMAELIGAIRALPESTHPVLGKGILELTDIKSSPYPGASVVPDLCRATYDRRLLVGEGRDSVLEPIRQLIAAMKERDPQFAARASFASGREQCYTGAEIGGERFFPAWLLEQDDVFVQAALRGLRAVGLDPAVTHYSFCTNGSHYAGEAGIPTIGFGPSREDLAHTIDEHIEIDQLLKAVRGYYGILQSVLA
jgi:putative selenium metabolism hydrolase